MTARCHAPVNNDALKPVNIRSWAVFPSLRSGERCSLFKPIGFLLPTSTGSYIWKVGAAPSIWPLEDCNVRPWNPARWCTAGCTMTNRIPEAWSVEVSQLLDWKMSPGNYSKFWNALCKTLHTLFSTPGAGCNMLAARSGGPSAAFPWVGCLQSSACSNYKIFNLLILGEAEGFAENPH